MKLLMNLSEVGWNRDLSSLCLMRLVLDIGTFCLHYKGGILNESEIDCARNDFSATKVLV